MAFPEVVGSQQSKFPSRKAKEYPDVKEEEGRKGGTRDSPASRYNSSMQVEEEHIGEDVS